MISNAASEIKALRLSDQFGSSAGSPFESGLDALKDTVVSHDTGLDAGPGAEISPLQSLMDGLGGGNGVNAGQNAPDSGNQNHLQQKLQATLAGGKTWQPTAHLNKDKVATNAVANYNEGKAKLGDANQKIAELKANVQDISRKMTHGADAGPGQNAAAAAQSPSTLGAMAGGLARDAVVTGGLTAAGMPFAAAAYGAATLAVALNGRGTLGIANSGEFSRTTTDRKGRVIDSGYTRSESPSPAAQSAGPETSAGLWNKLAQGPGFGRDGRKTDAGSVNLAGQSLTEIAALKMAEDSPAMEIYKKQRLDGRQVGEAHEAWVAKGGISEDPKLARPIAGMEEMALGQRAMLPGMHI